jgi:hypothetical protein
MAVCTALLLRQLLLARKLLAPLLLLQAASGGRPQAMRSCRQAAKAAQIAAAASMQVLLQMSAGALAQQVLWQHAEQTRVRSAVPRQAAVAAEESTAPAVALRVDKCLPWLQSWR